MLPPHQEGGELLAKRLPVLLAYPASDPDASVKKKATREALLRLVSRKRRCTEKLQVASRQVRAEVWEAAGASGARRGKTDETSGVKEASVEEREGGKRWGKSSRVV